MKQQGRERYKLCTERAIITVPNPETPPTQCQILRLPVSAVSLDSQLFVVPTNPNPKCLYAHYSASGSEEPEKLVSVEINTE